MIERNNETHKDKRYSDSDVVTLLLDLKEEVKAMQSNLASLRPDIIRLLAGRWKDERTRRRERCW